MKKEEADRIIQSIEKANKKDDSTKLIESIFKLVSTASLALVMWVLTTVNAMQKDLVKQSSDVAYMRNSIEKLEDFTNIPRFTEEHFNMKMVSVEKAIQSNSEAIISLSSKASDRDAKIQEILIELNKLK